jgi:phospholipase C
VHTRRDFLALGAAAVTAAHKPARKRKRRRPVDPIRQIEHIVILMQENCSFDHYFGTLRGVRGFGDPGALRLPDGQPVFYQPVVDGVGYLLPWHESIAVANPCASTVSNAWGAMHRALNGGAMDRWLLEEGPDTMRYFTRADIPWHMALADAFTVGDGYFASVLGPTNPNRLYSMTGTIDPAGLAGGPVTDDGEARPYAWTTYPERLQAHGISWRVYQAADNFDDNALAWFKAFQQAQPGSPLYENGMKRRPVDAFAEDVAAGALSQVSWLISTAGASEHPGYAPGPGASYMQTLLTALWAHPNVWAKTVVVVTYDEPGGYFDHVRPPLPPAGTPGEFIGGAPIGLGYRVPLIVCSPWSRGGYVCSDTFDHTSLIRLIERRFGVIEPQISAWRRQLCGDLTACLDLHHPDFTVPSLPGTGPLVQISADACRTHLVELPPVLG